MISVVLAASVFMGTFQTPAKRALLIGVDYKDIGLKLGTRLDVEATRRLLTSQFGFTIPDSNVLKTEQKTTSAEIVRGLRAFAAEVNEGDVAYIHYSGHGAQVPDQNNDELDMKDECLVGSESTDGSGLVRDDDLAKLISSIIAKKPKCLMVVFDACHSGTGLRGFKVRSLPTQGKSVGASIVEGSGVAEKSIINAPNLVFFSAASSNELAFDDGKGVFTHALLKALGEKVIDKTATTGEIMERATAILRTRGIRNQTPQLEGNANQVFLSSEEKVAKRYFLVEPNDEASIVMRGGDLQGVTVGSTFSLYPGGTVDPELELDKKICDAEVIAPSPFVSVLKLPDGVDLKKFSNRDVRAFEKNIKLPDHTLEVLVDSKLKDDSRIKSLLSGVAGMETILVSGQAFENGKIVERQKPFVLIRESKPGFVALERTDGTLISFQNQDNLVDPDPNKPPFELDLSIPSSLGRLRGALLNQYRFSFLENLSNPKSDPHVQVAVRVIKVEVNKDPTDPSAVTYKNDRKENAIISTIRGKSQEIKVGEYFRLEVQNVGRLPAYLNIIDLTNDGSMAVLWPPYNDYSAYLKSQIETNGAWIPLPPKADPSDYIIYQASEPYGNETLKILATAQPVDLSLMMNRTGASRGPENPLERILKEATMGQRTTIPDSAKLDTKNWSASEVRLTVTR